MEHEIMSPKITRVEIEEFAWDIQGLTHGRAFHYDPDSTLTRLAGAVRIHADNGAVGEYANWGFNPAALASAADWYLGRNPLDREQAYQVVERCPSA
jgi:hypothetical protein